MARIKCKQCGKKFSDSKDSCPQCETPTRQKLNLKWLKYVTILVIALGACAALFAISHWKERESRVSFVREYHHLPTLDELLAMSSSELAEQDLAVINLACAEGLYGAEDLDVKACLRQLDEWAGVAARLSKEREFMFHRAPEKVSYSINRWRCAALVQYLNQVIGLSYNPALKTRKTGGIYDTSYFRDSRDFLIHGLIIEKTRGTCASMPVLFTCVARRLGYPIRLVTTRNHLFSRWDDAESGEVFNIEMTDKYAEFKSDEFYKSFPAKLNPGEIERQGYLTSLSPEQELSVFLHLRAMCLWDQGRLKEARAMFCESASLDPAHRQQGEKDLFVLEIDRLMRQLGID